MVGGRFTEVSMKKWIVSSMCGLALVALPPATTAGDLGMTSEFLCAPSWAVSCSADHVCETGEATEWNIPAFVVADLTRKTLSTPGVVSDGRTTPIESVRSEDGLVFIQGHELGRAFSLVVSESTGKLSGSITTENLTIAVFGKCTRLPTEGVTP
jgi:hypothetical protein